MRNSRAGYRVAVVGPSSLMGKELLAVLEERKFPVSQLLNFEDESAEPDLPILNLQEAPPALSGDDSTRLADLDFAFVAATKGQKPAFLRALRRQEPDSSNFEGVVIDLCNSMEPGKGVLRVSCLDAPHADSRVATHVAGSKVYVSPHASSIVISTILSRLAAQFQIERSVAHVFIPASEAGPRGIEELQKQTLNLLSFQQVPKEVFGEQLAFNLLPRPAGSAGPKMGDIEAQIRKQLKTCLGERVPAPSLRLIQVPTFYSLAISLYLETSSPISPRAIGSAIAKSPVQMRRPAQGAPSPVAVAGSNNILVDAIVPDPSNPGGIWIWVVADNFRLAAVNAVEIAESLCRVHAF